jgi:dCMP deaminase
VTDWDDRFMNLALHVQQWSRDPRTKVGCVIVGTANDVRSIGYNGLPRGVDDNEKYRYEPPDKYKWLEHAERNAIYNAARAGISLDGCRMYVPWFPCADCARAIIQSGLIELIASEPDFSHQKWGDDFRIATQLLKEANVRVRFMAVEVSRNVTAPQ